jgi:hypothetical protein
MPVNSFSRVKMSLLGEFGVQLQLFAGASVAAALMAPADGSARARKYGLSPDGKWLVLLAQDSDTAACKAGFDGKDPTAP